MYKGKSTCRQLKKIRKMIAEQNHIPFNDSECHYEGDCAGTCPKCDAELRFLENALRKSVHIGKVVVLSGAALAISACNNQKIVEPSLNAADTIGVLQENFLDTEAVENSSSIPIESLPIVREVVEIEEVGLVIDVPDSFSVENKEM